MIWLPLLRVSKPVKVIHGLLNNAGRACRAAKLRNVADVSQAMGFPKFPAYPLAAIPKVLLQETTLARARSRLRATNTRRGPQLSIDPGTLALKGTIGCYSRVPFKELFLRFPFL